MNDYLAPTNEGGSQSSQSPPPVCLRSEPTESPKNLKVSWILFGCMR